MLSCAIACMFVPFLMPSKSTIATITAITSVSVFSILSLLVFFGLVFAGFPAKSSLLKLLVYIFSKL